MGKCERFQIETPTLVFLVQEKQKTNERECISRQLNSPEMLFAKFRMVSLTDFCMLNV
jgi:hypothetical protein